MMVAVEALVYRADVATLAAPETLDSGTVVFEVTLATVGDQLRYSWGVETATVEGLSDGVDDLVGLPVLIEDHPPINQGHVVRGDTGGRKTVGTIIGARFDVDSGQRIAQLAVHDPVDQRRARELGSVSEAYRAKTVEGDQISRIPNSVVIARRGRAGSARLRADTQEGLLDEATTAKLMEAIAGLTAAVGALTAKMDAGDGAKADEHEAEKAAADALLETTKADAESAAEAAKTASDAEIETAKSDAVTKVEEAEATVAERADALSIEIGELRADALKHGVEIPDTAKTAGDIRTALAVGLGCPAEGAARADTARTWIAARKGAPARTEKDRVRAAGNGGGQRADVDTSKLPC